MLQLLKKEYTMSTYYMISKELTADRLFDGSLDLKFGVREEVFPKTTETRRCLTDGHNYLWVSIDNETGLVALLLRYGANDPNKILNAITDVFDADIFSEHEPQFDQLCDERRPKGLITISFTIPNEHEPPSQS
jgi:hypothetical protein